MLPTFRAVLAAIFLPAPRTARPVLFDVGGLLVNVVLHRGGRPALAFRARGAVLERAEVGRLRAALETWEDATSLVVGGGR